MNIDHVCFLLGIPFRSKFLFFFSPPTPGGRLSTEKNEFRDAEKKPISPPSRIWLTFNFFGYFCHTWFVLLLYNRFSFSAFHLPPKAV